MMALAMIMYCRMDAVSSLKGLFVGGTVKSDVIVQLLEHAQRVSHWAAAELLICSNAKVRTCMCKIYSDE